MKYIKFEKFILSLIMAGSFISCQKSDKTRSVSPDKTTEQGQMPKQNGEDLTQKPLDSKDQDKSILGRPEDQEKGDDISQSNGDQPSQESVLDQDIVVLEKVEIKTKPLFRLGQLSQMVINNQFKGQLQILSLTPQESMILKLAHADFIEFEIPGVDFKECNESILKAFSDVKMESDTIFFVIGEQNSEEKIKLTSECFQMLSQAETKGLVVKFSNVSIEKHQQIELNQQGQKRHIVKEVTLRVSSFAP